MSKKIETFRFMVALVVCLFAVLSVNAALGASPGQGELTIVEPDGKAGTGCPLEHTSVKAEISGFVTRVEVKQIFHNPRQEKIEAVYTFPLSADAAVDEMLMKVGDRIVRGEIRSREEARQIYEKARDRGQVASLLDQERPNIFTQAVANIMPGERVEITISYVEILKYQDGSFTFIFPMVVGPRFIPGRPDGYQGTGWAPDTASVPDASRITPPVAEEGQRAGYDIDVTVSINAGFPVERVESPLHGIEVNRKDTSTVLVTLKNQKEIPNKDFVLKYLVASDQVRSAVLVHKEGEIGYATTIIIPPRTVAPEQTAARELMCIVDASGSQTGLPLEKAKETTKYIIDHMNPDDTFNIIDFNDTARVLFPSPMKNTPESREKALKYLSSLKGTGGTRMIPAIWEALGTAPGGNRLRIVTFMTDGLVGNDFEVLSMIKKLRDKSRWFSFGTGNSVNRFLLDNVARLGGGEVDYVLLNGPAETVAKKFYERVASPVLTDISVHFNGVAVTDVFPSVVSDVWSHKPLIFKARYTQAGKGRVTIKGFRSGKPYEETLELQLPEKESGNSSLKSLWARAKVDDLMDSDLMGMQRGNPRKEIKDEIVQVSLSHKIMTQFTSFVAVEEAVITVEGKPTRVVVPVEMPEGMSREGVFGSKSQGLHAGTLGITASAPRPASMSLDAGKPVAEARTSGGFSQRAHAPMKFSSKAHPGNGAVAAVAEPEIRPWKDDAPDRASSKLAPEFAALMGMKEGSKDYEKGGVTVKDGQVTVRVWLYRGDTDVLKLLEDQGLTITFKASTGKMVIGTIPVAKLEEVAKIQGVRFIEPFTMKG